MSRLNVDRAGIMALWAAQKNSVARIENFTKQSIIYSLQNYKK